MAYAALWFGGVSCLSSSVIHGSGRAAEGEFDISGSYSELSVTAGIEVEFIHSETGRGTISADERALQHVSIVEEAGRVIVSYDPQVRVSSPVPTIVRMPLSSALADIDASAAARVRGASRVLTTAGRLRIEASSAAKVNLDVEVEALELDLSSAAAYDGNVTVKGLTAELSSASRIKIEGSADYAHIDSSSAANFDGEGLNCRKADCEASSGSNIKIGVTDEIAASASSGSNINYRGRPAIVRRSNSSGGSVRNL